eukprot:scaffold7339_cov249-Pinguiococcus_pyrenoidosus.AAC.15
MVWREAPRRREWRRRRRCRRCVRRFGGRPNDPPGPMLTASPRPVFAAQAIVSLDNNGVLESINEYVVVRHIADGSFSNVYEVERNEEGVGPVRYAAKVMHKSLLRRRRNIERKGRKTVVKTALDNVAREVALMKKLEHPCIVDLVEVIDDVESDLIVMIMELMGNGPIMDYSDQEQRFVYQPTQGTLPEEDAAWTIKAVLLGIGYLHQNHVAHRDLKPENILRSSDGRVKISDFGVSHFFEEETAKERRPLRTLIRQESRGQLTKTEGTWAFWAPEMCTSTRKPQWSAYAADLWAAGVCLWVFIFGTLPFDASGGPTDLFDMIERYDDEHVDFPHEVSPDLADFIKRLLRKDPKDRMSVPDALAHRWIVTHCSSERLKLDLPVKPIQEPSEREIEMAFSPMNSIVMLANLHRRAKQRLTEARTRISTRMQSARAQLETATPAFEGESEEVERLYSGTSDGSSLRNASEGDSGTKPVPPTADSELRAVAGQLAPGLATPGTKTPRGESPMRTPTPADDLGDVEVKPRKVPCTIL